MIPAFGEGVIKSLPQYRLYKKWFDEAPDNARYVYYKGCSLTETSASYSLGKVILQDAYKGEVLLFQRRISKDMLIRFEYIAIRKRKSPRRLVPNKITLIAAE